MKFIDIDEPGALEAIEAHAKMAAAASSAATLHPSDLEELAARLRRLNEWRRGAEIEQPRPQQIGEDIDAAAALIEQMAQESEPCSRES